MTLFHDGNDVSEPFYFYCKKEMEGEPMGKGSKQGKGSGGKGKRGLEQSRGEEMGMWRKLE